MQRYSLSHIALGAVAGWLALAGAATAQEFAWEQGGQLVGVGGAFNDDGVEAVALAARFEAFLNGSTLFDNQIEVGVAFGLVGERDHPRADPRGDADGPFANGCSPLASGCLGAPVPTYRSIHAGFATGGLAAKRGGRTQLETAYVYVSGPLGEVSLGRQEGVAARFGLRPTHGLDGAFSAVSASNPELDLTGLGAPRLRDTLSGPSAKLTAATVRVLGLQAGVSYTPSLEAAGLDSAKRFAPAGTIGALPDSVWEAALSFSLRPPGAPNLSAGLTHSRASAERPQADFGAVETSTASVAVSDEGWMIGAAALEGDNGWRGAGERRYRSYGVRGGATLGDWSLGLEIATSKDDLTQTKWTNAVGTASISPFEGVTMTLGLQSVERRPEDGAALRPKRHTSGVFVGFGAKF